MIDIRTKYNRKENAVIITSPTKISIKEREYRAIQRLTDNEFWYCCTTGLIELRDNYIVGLNFSSLGLKPKELRENLGSLTSLEILHLEHNKIKRLPKSLMDLQKLRELHLTYNNITSLPKNIYKLKSLEEIYVGQNPIVSIPESILNMPSLEYLVIDRKNLDNPSKKIIKQLKQKKVKIVG